MIKKIILGFLLITLTTPFFVKAQSSIAHVNVQELLSQMPEMKSVQAELEKLQKTYSNDIQSSLKELQTKATTYQNEASVLSQEELEKRSDEFRKKGEELQKMEANIQQARQTASEELQKKQKEMLEPLLTKVQNTIKKVARDKGYKYVLDSSPGGTVIVSEGKNLIPEVKKELGF